MRRHPVYPQGWFSQKEMAEYCRLIRLLPMGGTLVEVGVWLGRSLCAASPAIHDRRVRVTAVDTFQKERARLFPPPRGGQLYAFLAHMKAFGLAPQVRQMTSLEAAALSKPVDMVFLDADHAYTSIAADIDAWLPKTTRILAGHDYGHRAYPGVKKAVDERFGAVTVQGQVWSVELPRG
jgi:hypothetical protein